jgi:hypothetical protein
MVWEDLLCGSFIGIMSEVMMVWVRVGCACAAYDDMSTGLLGECERSAFAMGVHLSMMMLWVSLWLLRYCMWNISILQTDFHGSRSIGGGRRYIPKSVVKVV